MVAAGASAYAVKAGEQQIKRDEAEAKTYVEDLEQALRQVNLDVECLTLRGSQVGEAIVDYVDRNQIDIIAIATHGHSGLGRLVFRSIADFVLRESGLPILLIKTKNT